MKNLDVDPVLMPQSLVLQPQFGCGVLEVLTGVFCAGIGHSKKPENNVHQIVCRSKGYRYDDQSYRVG